MEVEWTRAAHEHLGAIRAFISKGSPSFAESLVDRITARSWQLSEFPESGAIYGPARPLEIRFLLEGSYRILYIVGRDHVDIIGVVHTSRRLL